VKGAERFMAGCAPSKMLINIVNISSVFAVR